MTEKMAIQIVQAAQKVGVNAVIQKAEACTAGDLACADGLAVGCPTQYCNISWQLKRFMDETLLAFYAQGFTLRGKPCGCFTSSGVFADGQECVRMLEQAFCVALKMKIAPGLVLESKDVAEGNLGACSEFALRLAQELV